MSGWAEARDVLAVRLDTLGDVLMTSPALRALKAAVPGRRVTLLTSSQGAEAGRRVPEVDEVVVYDAPWLKGAPPRLSGAPEREMAQRLRERGFDAGVVFTVYSQSALPAALLLHLADVPLRLAHSRENPYHLLTRWIAETEPEQGVRHEVRRQLDLVAAVGAETADERLSLRVTERDRARARAAMREAGIRAGTRWLALHPGASAASRRYAPDRFSRIARILGAEGFRTVVLAGPGEERLATEVASAAGRAATVVSELDVGGLGALLETAPLLLANNSGPTHVASAVGTPVVDLYALTNAQHTPWGVPNLVLNRDVPCRLCYRSVCPRGDNACLDVPAREVAEAALSLLAAVR